MANEPDDSTVVAGDGPGAGYVQLPGIIALAAYLLVLTLGLVWELYAFWPSCDPTTLSSSTSASAKPSATPSATPTATPETSPGGSSGEPSPGKAATQPASVVKVTSVLPASGDIAGGTSIQIAGEGFLDKPTVKLGGSTATDVQMESATSISAKTPPHAEGAVDVTVTNGDNKPATLSSGYTYTSCLGQCRSRLPLLVLLAGALGACFHALRSLWMFVGNRDLKWSWALMYIVLPINGAVLAFIFFIVISAGSGFFAQPQGSNSCFWIIGIAALVGLASQQAAETLKKIAEAVFTGVPKKADPLSGGVSITSIVPATGPLAGGTTVTITGKGFTNTSTVTFGGEPGAKLKLGSPTSISVDTPPGKQPGPVDVIVADTASKAQDTKAGGFTYTAS